MVKCITKNNVEKGSKQLPPFYIPPKTPLQPGSYGVAIQTHIRSSQTDYQYTCVETAIAPKRLGPSPHFHKDLDEISFVLEGTLSVMVNDTVYEVPPGGMQMRPRGLVHTFWNATDKPVRFMDMFLNQNFDEYLEEFFRIDINDPNRDNYMAKLDREFGMTQFHERRQEIIDTYGLTN